MKLSIPVLAIAGLLLAAAWFLRQPDSGQTVDAVLPGADQQPQLIPAPPPLDEPVPSRAVLDISVHSIEELRVLFERAEQLAVAPHPGGEEDRIVLVLHGPEVAFFAISNYEEYRDIVDQAARLDAFDVVDVRICETMMNEYGLGSDDIPPFIERVPFGPGEVERLRREGYVYF
jgi:intracellular sulfur oxidation DsrE/DsrF family protein